VNVAEGQVNETVAAEKHVCCRQPVVDDVSVAKVDAGAGVSLEVSADQRLGDVDSGVSVEVRDDRLHPTHLVVACCGEKLVGPRRGDLSFDG